MNAKHQQTGGPLSFDYSPRDIRKACDSGVQKAERAFKALATVPDETRTFQNTVWAFDKGISELWIDVDPPMFLKYVSTNEEARNIAHECEVKISQYIVDISGREDLYKALLAYSKRPEAKTLTGERKRLLEKVLLDFKRNGMALPARKREKVTALKKELQQLEAQFGKNVLEYKDHLEVTTAELKGTPADFADRLKNTSDGKHIVTLSYPDYFTFMENTIDANARRRLEEKFYNRAAKTNVRLLEKALVLREKIARLLGYENHAAYVLEERMAKTPREVRRFLSQLKRKLQIKGRAELRELLALKRKDDPKAKKIRSWDWLYYDNQLKKKKYKIDSQEIKAYFPMEVVTEGLLEIYQELLGLTFRSVHPANAWHRDVKLYEVQDRAAGYLVGYFYMDLFPREGKYSHAAAFTLREGRALNLGGHYGYQRPVSAMVANFNRPTQSKPSLLTHDQVETYFHEFGHIMHQLLTRARFGYFSGTSVQRDFVEAPSQMLENWVWEADVLQKISGHHSDPSKKLPEHLRKQMIAAKNHDVGLRYLRQVLYASVDMAFHTRKMPINTTKVWNRLQPEIALIENHPKTQRQASFTHFMGGYDAGYYGYLWSKVYSADMFTRFQKQGLLDAQTGAEYRKWILEPGGSREPGDLLVGFLGRKPNQEAFLKSLGLRR